MHFQTLSCVLGISRGVLAVACQFWYQFVTVLDTSAVRRLQVHFSVDFSEIFQIRVHFCEFFDLQMKSGRFRFTEESSVNEDIGMVLFTEESSVNRCKPS